MSCGFQSDASIPVSATTRARAAPWIRSAAFSVHHQRAGVDVGRDKIRHGRGIDDAQPFDTPRAQFRIARLGLVRSHPAGARRMMRDQATRQAIVGAARRLFSERGYFATKWDDIATLA